MSVPTVPRRIRSIPYLLLAPALIVIVGVLGYPLATLVQISFQKYGLAELLKGSGSWTGLSHYTDIVGDSFFWGVVGRTIVFTAVNVALTVGAGTLIALLMRKAHRAVRLTATVALVAVWATPGLVAIAVWQWMFDYEFGVVNWLLTKLGAGDFTHHNWFENPVQGLGVVTAVIVWGAVPFVAISLHAALTQVPDEVVEAAELDGAGRLQVFRYVILPVIRPVLALLTLLQIIWDFQVFNQVWVMTGGAPTEGYYLIGVYSYVQSFGVGDYGSGAAVAVVMVLLLALVAFGYVRGLLRKEQTQ
ncbi:carbohydrate ABC transporter permease [Wenjunlia tyrosinilytica]|uniref:Sugar ABC transporter permease n=1 Tax=Wenjunlia tyrosinilytica TaxID=1544741 RepID=A0A918E315_9ACTN|nr:sugar ABC transporter permease [Wenjunlia tyrosinilytica]GGP00618.1 sugar ABC transporter permease [Wenjunlia tyrosinilytica]